MANIVAIETLLDGDRNTIIKVDIVGDGSGDEENKLIFDASAYENTTTLKKLYQLSYELNGFSAFLEWDGTPDKQLITIEESHYEHPYYDWVGGLSNANVSSATGDILLTTVGLGDGDRGYIILHVQHKEVPVGER